MSAARIIKGVIGGMVTAEGAIHHSKPYFDEDIYSKMMSGRRTDVMNDKTKFPNLTDSNGAASIKLIPSGYYGMKGPNGSKFIPVRGIITEMPTINLTANWVPSDSLNTVDKVVATAMENFSVGVGKLLSFKPSDVYGMYTSEITRAGANVGGYYKTKKFFQSTSPLSLSIKMKVVDWNGTGQPVASVAALMQYMVPHARDNGVSQELLMQKIQEMMRGLGDMVDGTLTLANETYESTKMVASALGDKLSDVKNPLSDIKAPELLKDSAEGIAIQAEKFDKENFGGGFGHFGKALTKEGAKIIKGTGTAVGAAYELTEMTANKIIMSMKDEVINSAKREIAENLNDAATLRDSPPPVEILIGEYYHHKDMVIKSMTIAFSKKMTNAGPLWVDVDLAVESRKAIDSYEYTGLLLSKDDSATANVNQSYSSSDGSSTRG